VRRRARVIILTPLPDSNSKHEQAARTRETTHTTTRGRPPPHATEAEAHKKTARRAAARGSLCPEPQPGAKRAK